MHGVRPALRRSSGLTAARARARCCTRAAAPAWACSSCASWRRATWHSTWTSARSRRRSRRCRCCARSAACPRSPAVRPARAHGALPRPCWRASRCIGRSAKACHGCGNLPQLMGARAALACTPLAPLSMNKSAPSRPPLPIPGFIPASLITAPRGGRRRDLERRHGRAAGRRGRPRRGRARGRAADARPACRPRAAALRRLLRGRAVRAGGRGALAAGGGAQPGRVQRLRAAEHGGRRAGRRGVAGRRAPVPGRVPGRPARVGGLPGDAGAAPAAGQGGTL